MTFASKVCIRYSMTMLLRWDQAKKKKSLLFVYACVEIATLANHFPRGRNGVLLINSRLMVAGTLIVKLP